MARRIVQAVKDSSAELGHLSSALLLLDAGLAESKEKLIQLRREVGNALPIFEAICRQGMSSKVIRRRIGDMVEDLADTLEGVDTLVITGVEVAVIDEVSVQYPEIQLLVVTHDRKADRRRVESNFSASVSLIDASDFQSYAHPVRSALLVPGFDVNQGAVFSTYWTASRILGEDTRNLFSEIVGFDLLGNRLHFYTHDLVEVSLRHFTQILHVPVFGNSQPEFEEVIL